MIFECKFSPFPPLKCGSFVCIRHIHHCSHTCLIICYTNSANVILGCIRQTKRDNDRAKSTCSVRFDFDACRSKALYKRIKPKWHNAMFAIQMLYWIRLQMRALICVPHSILDSAFLYACISTNEMHSFRRFGTRCTSQAQHTEIYRMLHGSTSLFFVGSYPEAVIYSRNILSLVFAVEKMMCCRFCFFRTAHVITEIWEPNFAPYIETNSTL